MIRLKRPYSTMSRASILWFTALTCFVSPMAAQSDAPWEELQRDLNTRLDRSLESLAGFANLDMEFHAHSGSILPSDGMGEHSSQAKLPYTAAPQPVQQFLTFFSGPARSFYRAAVGRLKRFRPMIDRVFGQEGVPPDLIWIGLVESGYNPNARSSRNAVGIWQLTPETAVQYGLLAGQRIDERTDPAKSTVAATRFLLHRHSVFQDWNLVLATYNSGEDCVLEAIAQGGTKNFWELARRKLLPSETRDYVPAVLAAIELGRAARPSARTSE